MTEYERFSDWASRRIAVRVIFAVCLLFPGPSAWGAGESATDRYVALIMGNGKYQGALALTQPAADAAAVARTLRAGGFQIISLAGGNGCAEGRPVTDLDREAIKAAVACFAKSMAGAKQAILYFSGHSVNLDGRNYLLPIGAATAGVPSPNELVDLRLVLDTLDQAGAELSVVILDAARIAAKDIAGMTPGLGRVAPTTSSLRIVAYSAPVGAWADNEPPTGQGDERDRAANPPPTSRSKPDAKNVADTLLSSYTRRLVRLIDDDLEARSLDQPALNIDTLLLKASTTGNSTPREIMNENAAGKEVLGRLPRIGKSACEVMNWRAENFGHCIEMAAAYENCGKDAAMRGRLQDQCPADWKTLVRYSLRASMVGAMKTKNCAALKDLMVRFETEPAARELDEFKEIRSLAQYTCATENRDKQQPTASLQKLAAAAKDNPDARSKSAPPSTNDFATGDNLDIWGQDILQADGTIGFMSADIASCTNQCQSTASCVAISFDRWKGKCYPKSKVVTALLDARSTIAVKKPLQLPSVSAAKIEFQTIRSSRFNSDPVARKRVSEFGSCRTACDSESRCVAFTFLKTAARNAPNCELFKLTNAYSRDSSVDSGYKYQSP